MIKLLARKLVNYLYLISLYFIYKFKISGINNLRPLQFSDWAGNKTFFSGYIGDNKVFIKSQNRPKTYMRNEFAIMDVLKSNSEMVIFPKVLCCHDTLMGYAVVYEFIDAPTLDVFFSENPSYISDKDFVNNLTSQFINILDVLYGNHIVHRDIRPGNLFVQNNRLILFDFAYSICLAPNMLREFNSKIERELGQHYRAGLGYWNDVTSILSVLEEHKIQIPAKQFKVLLDMESRISFNSKIK